MPMGVLVRSLAIILIFVTTTVSAAQVDLDALLRRLAEVEAEQAKYRETIAGLRTEIDALNAEAKDNQLAVQRADNIPEFTMDDPEKSEAQTSLPSTPGPVHRNVFPELANESQFVLQSDDQEFSLGIDGLIATRYEYNYREDDGTGSSDSDQGWETIATRLNFRGNVYKDLGYWIRFNADEFQSDPFIDAAMGMWYINDNTTLVVGQFPSLLTRDQGIPLDKLMVLESSPTNYAFDPFGFKGVMLGYHTPRLVFRGIINDGYRSANNSAFDEASADWAFAGQVVGMAVGDEDDWDRFNNFTSRPGSDFAWQLNGAFHVQEGTSHSDDPAGGGSDDLFLGIVESSMEGNGWNAYASGYYRSTDPADGGMSVDDIGFVIQGGAWVAEHFEVYSRFDMTIPDDDRPTEGDEFRTITTGVNFYPHPHTDNIKIGAEVLYMFDAEADSIVEPNPFSSVRASPDGDQWVFRTQAQIRW
jgi:hypothetical protein